MTSFLGRAICQLKCRPGPGGGALPSLALAYTVGGLVARALAGHESVRLQA